MKIKPLSLIASTALLASLAFPVYSEDLATCDDLTELETALVETIVLYQNNFGSITENDEVAVTLDQLIQAISAIHLGGQEAELMQKIEALQLQWNAINSQEFSTALGEVSNALDSLQNSVCI